MSDGQVLVGQVWQHKREGYRRITITGGMRIRSWGTYFSVERNTSNRKQEISEKTLRREYRLVKEAPDA